MKKAIVLLLSSLFFYSLFRELSLVKTLMLFAGIASAYAISRIPSRILRAGKYPLVGLSFALSPVLFVYPVFRAHQLVGAAAIFFAFYSIALFLVTTEEKGKQFYKEVLGLSLLYAASCINLFLTGHPALICPLSVSMLLFLFIINKVRVMPFIAGYTAAAMLFLVIRGISVFGPGLVVHGVERYLLLATAFGLFLIAFLAFVKRPDFASILSFFGLLYVSVDLLLSVGLKFKSVLLHQPALALFIIGPLMGMVLKGEKERL